MQCGRRVVLTLAGQKYLCPVAADSTSSGDLLCGPMGLVGGGEESLVFPTKI